MAIARLLEAVGQEDPDDFIALVEDHVNRADGVNLEEALEAAQRKELPALCEGLRTQAERGAALFAAPPPEDQQQAEDADVEEAATPQELASTVLYGVALVARLLLKECGEAPPPGLAAAARTLHDEALLAAADYPALQEEVARLCLEWWQAEAPGRERLTPQTVPYLLLAALQQGTGAAVKRCHAMRTALALFDFDDPSAADLKRLLLQAAFAPAFLKATEGRRFISYLFELQPAFVRELTAIIRNQIPSGRKSVLDAYGDILYRAWTKCTGACALELQQGCIQGLMEAAILASTPTMAANLRRVLAGFHGQKHQAGVDRLLLELYEPILFRRLNAAHPEVRRNALAVFLDAFPLRDPEEGNEETDRRLGEQFALLTKALRDEAPAVRVAAVHGVCRVLNEYWELIPAAVTAGYVKQLAGELALDAASPAVRAAVAEGLAALVDNALAQPVLKAVLPQLEPMLYDASARVRCAFADLLLSLRGIQALPWHGVVTPQKLLDVMASDAPAVSERIQRLLLPSYLPDLESGPALVAALLRTSPDAGRAFCHYLVGAYALPGAAARLGTGPAPMAVHEDTVLGLISDLKAHLLEAPLEAPAAVGGGRSRAGKGGKGRGRSKRKKGQPQSDGEEPEEEAEVVESAESWTAILEGLQALACGLAAQLEAGQASAECADGLFHSGTLVALLDRCPSSAARRAVMAIAAALPALDASAEVRGRCLKRLLSGELGSEAGREAAEELRGAVACMSAGASCPRLLKALALALHAEEEDVLATIEGEAAPAADGAAAEEGQEQPEEKQGGRRRAARASKPTAAVAAAKGGGKKKQAGGSKRAGRDSGVVDASLSCQECGSSAGDMLLCDYCEKAFHLDCLDPPLEAVPDGDWFCASCEAEMAAGMGEGAAVRVLGLLLEEEAPRAMLLRGGLLARLLPCLDSLLEARVGVLRRAVTDGAAVPAGEGGAAASAALVVYAKACLHLYLAAAGPSAAAASDAADAPLAGGAAGSHDGQQKQALECMQQAMEWASALVQALDRADVEDLLAAVEVGTARDAKRAKSGKGKGAAEAVQALPGPAAALREAYESLLAMLLVLGEAARVRMLPWGAGVPSAPGATAQGTAAVGGAAIALLGRMAKAVQGGGAAQAEEAVASGVALVARLARGLAASVAAAAAGSGAGTAARDLNSENWAAASSLETGGTGSSGAEGRAAAVTALAELVGSLMAAACEGQAGLVAAALKPHLAGLVAAVAEATRSSGEAATSASTGNGATAAAGSAWLRPVAELLGAGFDLDDLPADAAGDKEAAAGGNENAGANADGGGADDGGAGGGSKTVKAAEEAVARASSEAGGPLVKALLSAARLVKAQELLAGQAGAVAAEAWAEGRAVAALGALELACLTGFKGVNSRGRTRAGGDSFSAAIAVLRPLADTLQAGAPLPQADEAAVAVALLGHKLTALFPPPARVTFDVAEVL